MSFTKLPAAARRLAAVVVVAFTASPAPAAEPEALLRGLALCQLPHLTMEGWLAAAPSRFYRARWSADDLEALARDARDRHGRTGVRGSRRLQLAQASSYQAAVAYDAVARRMRAEGVASVERTALERAAAALYEVRREAAGVGDCAPLKWGNFWPDIVLQPLPRSTDAAIAALFAPGGTGWPPTPREAGLLETGALTREELSELRALRLAVAIFENQFGMLRTDLGGWLGNLDDGRIVCTDEATTLSFLFDRLQEQGLLTRFAQHAGRFAYRDPVPPLPTDHFAVMLRNLRTGDWWVLDSWVEDGGVPPRIGRLEEWFAPGLDPRMDPGLISVGDAALDAALAEGLVSHARPDWMRRLRDHLARLAPALARPVPDGRPTLCADGFNPCAPPPRVEAAWGPVRAARGLPREVTALDRR
jgi:hypothetical protein